MRNTFMTFLVLFVLFAQGVTGQEKKRLSHEDYAGWKSLAGQQISPDGEWVIYHINPQDGDGELVILNLKTNKQYRIPRGSNASFSPGGSYVVSHIKPQKDVVRQAKVEKKKAKDMPSDSLAIFTLADAQLKKWPGLASYKMPEEPSDWFVYQIDFSKIEQPEPEKKPEGEDQEQDEEPEKEDAEPDHKSIFIHNPVSGHLTQIDQISEYLISPFGNLVAAVVEVEENDSLSLQQVHVFSTKDLELQVADSREGTIKRLNADRQGAQLAWMHSADTTKTKVFDLYLWEARRGQLAEVVDNDTPGMPEGYSVSENRAPSFSHDGERLFLGTAPSPQPDPKDTLLDSEKYSVDIWHWQDDMIQPQQQVRKRRDAMQNFLAVYHIRKSNLVQLADEELNYVSLDPENNIMKALGSSSNPYLLESTWTGSAARDLYVVDLADGSRTLIKERAESSVSLSPGGKFIIWYDHLQKEWMSYDIDKKSTTNISANIPEVLYDEEHDIPRFAGPHGIAGWAQKDEYVLIYDRYDIWKVDPAARKAPENMTQGYGRDNNLRLRLQSLKANEHFVDLSQPLFLEAFHYYNKKNGFFTLNNGQLVELILEDARFAQPIQARDDQRLIWRRSTFNEYANLWTSNGDFSEPEKISEVNPQQDDYYWGSVKLVEWEDFDNQTLQGLMYFPENYDPAKKYPTLVYFYERSSNGLHQHYIPSPSRSTINRSYCTSNDYIVFVPDITYKTGYPGESAYNAIVSGTKAMIKQFPCIDQDNIGLQGQSWGGYQIAYLVTRTNMYKAAMAGAPVSNMVSAYGGIRWQSGMSRQFQYENTQSRIGGTLWEKPFRYIENSPVFFADKVETPLLIMHNDADGAVPWYQGIEMFMAMRRLSKPVWMLVYNGEAHNLTRWPNRMDLSVRMYQFFDHYLKEAPAPVWLHDGLPALEKGKEDGYDLKEN